MSNEVDFENEFMAAYSQDELEDVRWLIEKAMECDSSEQLTKGDWNLSLSVEKHHRLQYSYHIDIYKEVDGQDDEEVCLLFSSGIDNGTELIEYSLEGVSTAHTIKTESIVIGIKPDWLLINPKVNKKLAESVVMAHKEQIMDNHRKQSYDNYMTGGGTESTDKHYKALRDSLHNRGIYWEYVYEEIEVDRNFV